MISDSTFLLSALALGFLGSFHCIGMCGPIALALPLNNTGKSQLVASRLLYNIGRIVTYSLLGLVLGMMGYAIALKGFQEELSIATGILIIAGVVVSLLSQMLPSATLFISKLTSPVKRGFKKLFGLHSLASLFFIGLLNGLLPCGFVYIALGGAISTGSYTTGMLYMFLFGLGTLPMMFSLSIAGSFVGLKTQRYLRKATPLIALVLALLLIQRGITSSKDECCKQEKIATTRFE
jgi:hypothetical protein